MLLKYDPARFHHLHRSLNDGNDGIRGGTIRSGGTLVAPGSLAPAAPDAATGADADAAGGAQGKVAPTPDAAALDAAAAGAAVAPKSSYFGSASVPPVALPSP